MSAPAAGVFRSLRSFNYRVWAAGALVSNVGTWIQRTAQDWLVLTQLTHHDASAVGIVMSLQFGPQLLLLPWTGYAADRFNQRRLLMTTQALMGGLALALGLLTVTGVVQLWHVYLFAFLFGCASAFDAPVRQTFVVELVGDRELANAVALNSTSFNAARMIGPAAAGFVIASVGTGWAFLINGVSFVAVLASLSLLRADQLRENARAGHARGSLLDGFRYVWQRPDLKATLAMLFLIGTFGLNFPLFISTMAAGVFHVDARGFGILSSMMAVGTISGALLAARREQPVARRDRTELLAVRGSARADRDRRDDLHHVDQCADAAVDRAGDARTRDGAAPRGRVRRHADRRTGRGLGREPSGSALGARRRRGVRVLGGARRRLFPDADGATRAGRRRRLSGPAARHRLRVAVAAGLLRRRMRGLEARLEQQRRP